MQNMVSASAPMVAAVSPRTRIRLQSMAATKSAGAAIQGGAASTPPSAVASPPMAANSAIASARTW
jgi:hypothetical protein